MKCLLLLLLLPLWSLLLLLLLCKQAVACSDHVDQKLRVVSSTSGSPIWGEVSMGGVYLPHIVNLVHFVVEGLH
jgi:hypothetical protein